MTDTHVLVPDAFEADSSTIPVFARCFGSWQISVGRRALSLDELTQRYDESAPRWQAGIERLGFPAAYDSVLQEIMGDEMPARVLDCGVGTGALSQALIRVVKAPFALTAVDLSPRMLEQAKQVLQGTDADLILRQADAEALPYDDNTFDLVMTAHMLEHLVDPSLALSEMVRVLKPGGRLIACLTRRSWLGMMIHLKWRTHRVTPSQAQQLLAVAGLDSVDNVTFGAAPWCRQLSLVCTGHKPF